LEGGDQEGITTFSEDQLSRKADAGDVKAMCALGAHYMGKEYCELGMSYYLRAAAKGHAGAMVQVAIARTTGNGVVRNILLALQLLERAAKTGNSTAVAELIDIYSLGKYGIDRDEQKVRYWTLVKSGVNDTKRQPKSTPRAKSPMVGPSSEMVSIEPSNEIRGTTLRTTVRRVNALQKTFSVSLVGMRFYSPPFDSKIKICECSEGIGLLCEPSNPHDPNAVAVLISGHRIGHLDQGSAKAIFPLLTSGANYQVRVDCAAIRAASERTIPLEVVLTIDLQEEINAPRPVSGRGAGLYCIKVEGASGIYIGQANDVNKRVSKHWKDLTLGSHANSRLQEVWNRLGPHAFAVSVLECAPTGLSPLELQRWLGDRERLAIEEARRSGDCLNIQDGEIVTTKAALAEYEKERRKADREHNAFVRGRKREIKSEIEALQRSQRTQLAQPMDQLRVKRDELNCSIRRNSGLRGLVFGKAPMAMVDVWKRALQDVSRELASLQAKVDEIDGRIRALRAERRTLMTVKQRETKIEGIFMRSGIARSGRGRIA
jgi:hypothetical protein